ncbi:protein kintoun isoform X2 [Triplophysa dalaica]|uniref:protein kintoun isoform X2 n=1 Tax=Triplophysa dalaica TaxID=1582913 RepID=UPI0024E01C89|nr:protein kintoun isoform X2 [Triplophysa dalaica]
MEALNLTRDEVNRMSEALKDETFRQLLSEYAAEISNPDNKRQYEEDITQLEADRGMHVQFIHPQAHHVLKSSSAGGKCFINVCCDPLIDKPSCEAARDRDGNAGHNWTLPHSLTPGRPDRDAKGNACVIYDAVFHPDALHMAEKNARFMKLIDSTAIGGIEDSFQIKLDSSTIKLLKSKYKGVPHPAVIRKPTSEFMKHQQSKCEEKLTFPYPDVCSAVAPRPDQTASSSSKQSRKPNYTLKYRSVVDLQNYRHSRDSTSSTRPKDIMVIIDLPLLTSARDVDVHVTERRLVLETQRGSYKLELSLSYPVDEVKNTESPQMICDDDEDEEERDSEDKAELMQKEKPHKTEQTALKSEILTQSTSDGFGQKTVAVESLCLSNSCDVDEINPHTYDTIIRIIMNPTESRTETDHFPHTCVAEIIPDEEENLSDMNIDSHEMTSVCNICTHMETSFGATAHEALVSRNVDKIYQNSMTSKQPNVFPALEEEPQRSSGLTKPLSQKPETKEPHSTLNPGNDMNFILNKEIQVQAKEPADIDNNSKLYPAIVKETESDRREIIICDYQTSAALCFQNSLCFDLE